MSFIFSIDVKLKKKRRFFYNERNGVLEEVIGLVGNFATNYPNVQEFINIHFSKYFHRNPRLFEADITEV